MEKVSIDTAIKELHEYGARTRMKKGIFMRNMKPVETDFTIGDFYVEANVVEVEVRDKWTQDGNIFTRLKVRDESREAVLVVWGRKDNQKSLKLFRKEFNHLRIRIIHPVRPFNEYIEKYEVDLWAHEELTEILVIEKE